MTLIKGWIACDNKPQGKKKTSALYFGSDSRVIWNQVCGDVCDTCQKVFCCNTSPEIFAICGHVSFVQQTLPHLTSQIDTGIFFSNVDNTAKEKAEDILQYFVEQKTSYRKFSASERCVIYYGTKVGTSFSMYKIEITQNEVKLQEVPMQCESCVLDVEGSGKNEFNNNMMQVTTSNESDTSRGVYHCISKTIENSQVLTVGGMPQIVALYRGLPTPQVLGIIKGCKRYLLGSEITHNSNLSKVEWRDDYFQRIDPNTLKLLEGAQPQPFVE